MTILDLNIHKVKEEVDREDIKKDIEVALSWTKKKVKATKGSIIVLSNDTIFLESGLVELIQWRRPT